MKLPPLVVTLLLLCSSVKILYAQDAALVPDAGKVTSRYLDAVADKSGAISSDIDKQTGKYLDKLQRQEARIYKKLAKKD
ncbi:MAG TPA: hypothetical protein VLD19_10525, partial [Chitinophagaceae bacterium]|nr:hypothetical protein [Chitinophagaceae bacterium]